MNQLYPHINKLINFEQIKNTKFLIFPKLDGSNCRIGFNGKIYFGTRNLIINEKSDFKNFIKNVKLQIPNLLSFFDSYPNLILFGEYLWNNKNIKYKNKDKFIVFDVYDSLSDLFLRYNEYKIILGKWNIDFVEPFAYIENSHDFIRIYDDLISNKLLSDYNHSKYILNDADTDEGLIFKLECDTNMHEKSKNTFKVISSEYKELMNRKRNKKNNLNDFKQLSCLFCSESYIEKEFEKFLIEQKNSISSKDYFLNNDFNFTEFREYVLRNDFVKVEIKQVDEKFHAGLKTNMSKKIDDFIRKNFKCKI